MEYFSEKKLIEKCFWGKASNKIFYIIILRKDNACFLMLTIIFILMVEKSMEKINILQFKFESDHL